MKKYFLILISFFIVAKGGYSQDSPLKLTIKANKEIYKIGEKIYIHFVVQNVSDKNVKIAHAKNINFNLSVSFTDSNGKECPQSALQTVEPEIKTIILKPKETLTHKITGTITEEKGYIGGKNDFKNVYGIFVRSTNVFSSYLSNNYGKYLVQCSFHGFKSENELQQLVSNRIEINIIENN